MNVLLKQIVVDRLLYCSLFVCVLLACPPVSLAQARTPMSTDELLEYTLRDLKVQMQKVADNNARLRERNNALRKRIFSLKQKAREYENRKIELLEYSVEGKDVFHMDRVDASTENDHIRDLKNHIKELNIIRLKLEQSIEADNRKKGGLRTELSRLKGDIERLQEENEQAVTMARRKWKKEKHALRQKIRSREADVHDITKDIARLEKRLVDPIKKRAALLKDNMQLKGKLAVLEQEVLAEADDMRRLNEQAQDVKRQKNKVVNVVQIEIDELRDYRNSLNAQINQSELLCQSIQSEFSQNRRDMKEWAKSLSMQNKYLARKSEVLADVLKSAHALKKVQEEVGIAGRQNTFAVKKGELVRADHDETVQMLNAEKATRENLEAEKEALQKDIDELQARLKEARKMTQAALRVQDKDKLARLNRALDAQEKTNNGFIADIKKFNKQFQSLQDQIDELKSVREENSKIVTALQQEIDDLKSEKKALEDHVALFEIEKEKSLETVQQDIEALKLRESLLSSTVQAVETQYKVDELEVQGYQKQEEAELLEYLSLLKDENIVLLGKLNNLMAAKDKLQAQKEELGGTSEDAPPENAETGP